MSICGQFASALRDPSAPAPPGLVAWNGSDPRQRFAIHRNNVVASLVDALTDNFPVTQLLVGEAFFRAMARQFALSAPPRSPVLACYGGSFPAFIADFAPAASLPYLADLARLEFARVRSFHAPDAPAMTAGDIADWITRPDDLPHLHIVLHPSLSCLRATHAAVSLWAAHQEGGPALEDVEWTRPENALVIRQDLDVLIRAVDDDLVTFISQLESGATFGAAAAATFADHPRFDLSDALGVLLRLGAIRTFLS